MKNKKILLIDEDENTRIKIKRILTSNGFNVCGEGHDGIDALEKCESLHPDLVIMEIVMSYMDGLAVLKAIKKNYPESKIVICTDMGQKIYVVDAIKSGAADFIIKPFQTDRMITTVTKLLK